MNESLRTRSTAATVACQILAGQISGTGYGLLLYLLEVVFLYRDAHPFMGGSLTSILALYLFLGWVVGSVAGLAAAVFMWIGIGFLKGRFFAGLPASPGARRMIRNTLALLAVFSVAGTAGLSCTEARSLPVRTAVPESSPNVVLVVVDGLRADHVSASGYKTSATPNLDRLAREGTSFTNAYPHGSTSDAALPALFTSTYPSPGSITVKTDGVVAPAPWKTTIVDMFRNTGYTTVGIMGNVYVRGPLELTRRFDYVEEFDVFRFNLSVYRIFAAVKMIAIPGHAARGIPDAACVTDLGLRRLEQLERRPVFLFLNCADVRFSCRPPENGVPDFDGWKLMRADSTGTYDLASDPWGTVNAAGSHAGQLGKLKLRMEEYFETVREVEDDETLPLSTEEGRRSRAPGHLR